MSLPDFSRCNETELYQLCRRAGVRVHPSATKVELISYLLGENEPPPLSEAAHPIDSWRHGLTGFVFAHWARLEPQLTCPIKSKDPRSCWGCLDTQVIACVSQNPQNEHLIELHRKREQHVDEPGHTAERTP
jgi:hypothetical protein